MLQLHVIEDNKDSNMYISFLLKYTSLFTTGR